MLFWSFWASPNGRKKEPKIPQVGEKYIPISMLENKPLTKIRPILAKEMVQTQKIVFYAVLGHLGTPNGPKKVLKGPQMDRMYVLMSKLENKPLTKSLGPFF
jgi:hypothetical protein